jgi:hypothetical protein
MKEKQLPSFKKLTQTNNVSTPEEVFFTLTRASTHGYLRGQQQDVLREYAANGATSSDVAFELPTGTGKTVVGLLLAEWKRRSGEKTAYLTLTNQLAAQVISEASKLGVPIADLRGDKYTRNSAEVGKFSTNSAIGISTYSNLFNINPVIKGCGLVVFDDAHGGEHYANQMWTLTIDKDKYPERYSNLLGAIRPALSRSQQSEIMEGDDYSMVQIADIVAHPECIALIHGVLDEDELFQLVWRNLRSKLASCLFLISSFEITIRPLIPPLHTHEAFANIGQRVYLSATLGEKSDLQRAYCVKDIEFFRAKSAHWGRRYIFVPGLFVDEDTAQEAAANIWDALSPRRALLIAPSNRGATKAYSDFAEKCENEPIRLGADDISDELSSFTESVDSLLVLGGRYDGLDLPDDDCRLLLLVGNPAASTTLERHMTSKWKMGPATRRNGLTRLIQGMGRCTRSATDFAVVLWLGQSLVDIACSKSVISQMPIELQKELTWGIQQFNGATEDLDTLVEMVVGLITDLEYRREANDVISRMPTSDQDPTYLDETNTGTKEVQFSIALWDGDYQYAHEKARQLAEQATSPKQAGLRGWWWYMASIAASLSGNQAAEIDNLWHSNKSGVNTGFTAFLLDKRNAARANTIDTSNMQNVEKIWDIIQFWGWGGPGFDKVLATMLDNISSIESTKFHQGLEILGKCLGAITFRPTAKGAPDVIWELAGNLCICFEAKTEKGFDGVLFKKDFEEARLHPDWVKFHKEMEQHEFVVVIVSQTSTIDKIAEPFVNTVYFLSMKDIQAQAQHIATTLRRIRTKYAGRDYAESEKEFAAEIYTSKLDYSSVKAWTIHNLLHAEHTKP